jgi:hypothetical protein
MLIISASNLSAQEILDGDSVYTVVPEMPQYPGGEEKLIEYLHKNIKYPAIKREESVTSTFYITFIIDKNGKAIHGKILEGTAESVNDQLLKAIDAMPLWIPGKLDNRTVNVRYNLPMHICFLH